MPSGRPHPARSSSMIAVYPPYCPPRRLPSRRTPHLIPSAPYAHARTSHSDTVMRTRWTRLFIDYWRTSQKRRRLRSPDTVAKMIKRHWEWDRLPQTREQVTLGFVAGLNNKILVPQRPVYGLRGETYRRLNILTSMLPVTCRDGTSTRSFGGRAQVFTPLTGVFQTAQ